MGKRDLIYADFESLPAILARFARVEFLFSLAKLLQVILMRFVPLLAENVLLIPPRPFKSKETY